MLNKWVTIYKLEKILTERSRPSHIISVCIHEINFLNMVSHKFLLLVVKEEFPLSTMVCMNHFRFVYMTIRSSANMMYPHSVIILIPIKQKTFFFVGIHLNSNWLAGNSIGFQMLNILSNMFLDNLIMSVIDIYSTKFFWSPWAIKGLLLCTSFSKEITQSW